ncbi:MAG: hypothetical protein GEU74_13380 [Nitriliruptorales bacterium]|nr:hypothetical protein [Nitriliruptorales bacterium]
MASHGLALSVLPASKRFRIEDFLLRGRMHFEQHRERFPRQRQLRGIGQVIEDREPTTKLLMIAQDQRRGVLHIVGLPVQGGHVRYPVNPHTWKERGSIICLRSVRPSIVTISEILSGA